MNSQKVIEFFKEIASIPRASGDEKKIADYLENFAKERNLEFTRDEKHNIIIKKKGKSSKNTTILQGHTDMVYVKAKDSNHNYEDGIKVLDDGKYLYAEGTSLGADNGIAVAYIMAVLDDKENNHPDIEAVFTVEEETGLFGAEAIDFSDIKATKFINIDFEDEGVVCTSCAGGKDCTMKWDKDTETIAGDLTKVTLTIKDLAGGHSGICIGNGLGNAAVLAGRMLTQINNINGRMISISVEGKSNVIANNAEIKLVIPTEKVESLKDISNNLQETFRKELELTDKISIELSCTEDVKEAEVLKAEKQQNFTSALMLIPNGVFAYSFGVKGLVETSMNIGEIKEEDNQIVAVMSIRSSVESQKELIAQKLELIGNKFADKVEINADYPGWQYNPNSELRELALQSYKKLFDKEGKVEAIHAGLECGFLDSKKPGMDIISIGPNLYDVHSVKEKVDKQSVENVWLWLQDILKNLV